MDGESWLAAVQDRTSVASFPAASIRGEPHAANGRPGMVALGLREAWRAQRNGFTAVRNTDL